MQNDRHCYIVQLYNYYVSWLIFSLASLGGALLCWPVVPRCTCVVWH